jgi:hypothetical protein
VPASPVTNTWSVRSNERSLLVVGAARELAVAGVTNADAQADEAVLRGRASEEGVQEGDSDI